MLFPAFGAVGVGRVRSCMSHMQNSTRLTRIGRNERKCINKMTDFAGGAIRLLPLELVFVRIGGGACGRHAIRGRFAAWWRTNHALR
jgi:hypothetical protein